MISPAWTLHAWISMKRSSLTKVAGHKKHENFVPGVVVGVFRRLVELTGKLRGSGRGGGGAAAAAAQAESSLIELGNLVQYTKIKAGSDAV